jgi:ABC-type molybdate transport system permease subunit
MALPPVISQPPRLLPTKKPFAFQAAQASLMCPLMAVGVSIVVNVGLGNQPMPMVKMITGGLSVLLIVLGFVFGIVALVGMRRHGRQGIMGRAIAGVCINGLLIAVMVASIPVWMRAAASARQADGQATEQQQPQP